MYHNSIISKFSKSPAPSTLDVCRRGDTRGEPLPVRVETIIFRGWVGEGGLLCCPLERNSNYRI